MLRALLYFRGVSFANWLLSRLRRLRQPKYLLGAIVGVAYFYFFFFRPFEASASSARAADAAALLPLTTPADWLPLTSAIGALVLLVFMTCLWVVPAERASLGFSEAEITFLFPAPISRRSLVQFRILSAQFRSLAGAAFMMLISHRWTFLGGNALTHALGWWFVFAALNLHLHGARFTLTRLADLGVGLWRRRLLVLALLVAIVVAALARLPAAPALASAGLDLRPLTDWLIALAGTAPLSWLLWPFELLLAPFLAPDLRAFLLSLAPALAILTLHYLWVLHAAVAFEDAAVDQAQKRSARLAALQSGTARIGAPTTKPQRAPFRLLPTGRPELAFLWKNLLSTWPYFNRRVFLACAALILLSGLWLNFQPDLRPILAPLGFMVLALALYLLIVGPQFARQDFRRDLANTDILKTYPLAGWQIVVGQLLTPTAILTSLLWLALLAIALLLQPVGHILEWLTPSVRIVGALCLTLLVPPLAALQLLVPNAAALLFPGWFHSTTRAHGNGPEVIGQRMIFFFAQLVTMLLALFPAVALAGSLLFIAHWLIGPLTALVVATFAALLILLGELWCGVWLLGRRFDQLDLSAELHS